MLAAGRVIRDVTLKIYRPANPLQVAQLVWSDHDHAVSYKNFAAA